MARPERILSLNLGMQTVSLAEFGVLPGGGLQLLGFAKSELILDSAADATRPLQIETVAKELRETLKAKVGAPVYACLPSQAVFSRFLKLPGATPEDVESIVGFEAQQNIPFPIEEVVWNHQIMGDRRDESWDVALVAIKTEQLTEVLDATTRGGLSARNVDVAPMALYNAFRYNYPELEESSLLIDLGARTTNLIFSENGRAFSRSIPIGGHAISAAIAKEFEQDITLAEKLKIEKGLVGLGGAYADPEDPIEARLSKVIRNTMTRLHAEIARSVNFYRSTHGGSTPLRVFLCGGSTPLRYIAEFFVEKLQARVEFFNPLKNVVVAEGALPEETPPSSYGLGELVGCALRGLGNCPMEIALTPPAVVQARIMARRIPNLALAAALLIAIPILWWFNASHRAALLEVETAPIIAEAQALQTASTGIDASLKEKKALDTEIAPFLLAAAERSAWSNILNELSAKLPTRFIWVTHLAPVETEEAPAAPNPKNPTPTDKAAVKKSITHIEVKGLYLDNPPNEKGTALVDEFYDQLAGSPVFGINETTDRSSVITERTTPTGEAWAYGFTMRLPLKTPIILP
ncbi:MAG: type pilus assembly protein PilM [Verrucomicrobiota bacterium]|jgi:type IV pilus assembly protein PilM